MTTQQPTTDIYDGTDDDEDMYYNEETTTLDNMSTFNRPATLTEEQMINNIAISLEDTINIARAAKEAGLGDILRNSRILNLINLISDAAYEKSSKQMEAMMSTLHIIAGKIDNIEERLTQKLQKHAKETEGKLTATLQEVKMQVENSTNRINERLEKIEEMEKHASKPESYAKAVSRPTNKPRETQGSVSINRPLRNSRHAERYRSPRRLPRTIRGVHA